MNSVMLILGLIFIIILAGLMATAYITFYLLSDRRADISGILKSEPGDSKSRIYRTRVLDREWLLNREEGVRLHTIVSHDGLKLSGRLYMADRVSDTVNDRYVLLVHGFHSNGIMEFSSIARFYLEHGVNVLLIDNRASGESEGRYITYTAREQTDVYAWTEQLIEYAKGAGHSPVISIHGMSMGAATALTLTDRLDTAYVRAIVSDCGYTSTKGQIMYTLKHMQLPARLMYGLYRFMCRLKGLYDPDRCNPVEHLHDNRIPVVIIHGEEDDVVPEHMANELKEACTGKGARLILNSQAGHTESFYDSEEYKEAILEVLGISPA